MCVLHFSLPSLLSPAVLPPHVPDTLLLFEFSIVDELYSLTALRPLAFDHRVLLRQIYALTVIQLSILNYFV